MLVNQLNLEAIFRIISWLKFIIFIILSSFSTELAHKF